MSKLNNKIEEIIAGNIRPNYKSMLQEYTQAKYKKIPAYQLKDTSGPDHDKRFTVEVYLGHRLLGKGTGKNKKSAEMDAAQAAYEKLLEE